MLEVLQNTNLEYDEERLFQEQRVCYKREIDFATAVDAIG